MTRDRTLLSAEQLEAFLAKNPTWRVGDDGSLDKIFEFPSFMQAIDFVHRVAAIAERHDHHPDIDIRFRRVRLRLITHDAKGLTFRDPLVAEECESAI